LPYCSRCGAKIEEDAHFCHKCGTPILGSYNPPIVPPPAPSTPLRKDPIVIAAIILISILIVGVFAVALLTLSITIVKIEQSIQENTANVHTLDLNFQSSAATINILTQKINNYNFFITLNGTASKRLVDGESGNPVQLIQYNNTVDGVLSASVILEESPAFSRLNLVCNIYLNPELNLDLNITSKAGQISLTADRDTNFHHLNLVSSAGQVQANLENSTISGNLALRTQAGTVDFRMNQVRVEGNNSVILNTNAGSVNMDITETKTFPGNLQLNASTNLGSINLGLTVDGDIAAKITSQNSLGSIHVTQENFSGNQSPIQSNNYPSQSNIEINNNTNLGSINIDAKYQSSTIPIIRN
jgi:hypothetical protein